jgi:hypothetical protein
METLALIQLLSQLLPTLINILMHYEELAKNSSEQDKEKMKVYLDTLKWKDWTDLKKEVENTSTGTAVNTPA